MLPEEPTPAIVPQTQGIDAPRPPLQTQVASIALAEIPSHVRIPQLPGYSPLERIGQGGMGIVYRSRQLALDRPVAIKMILGGDYLDTHALVRFRLEAELSARINHPQVVQVYESGVWEGRPYLVMEWVDGGNLSTALAGRPLAPREAAALAESLARAVHAAHCCGVVHRDLKPSNVLLSGEVQTHSQAGEMGPGLGQIPGLANRIPKITDFGLAKPLERSAGLTQSNHVVGTPAYMAPEQASGQQNVGPAADIHALGAMLYEFLTGRPPFADANAMVTLLRVVSEEALPPSRLVPGLPRDLEAICLQCLVKDPRRRPATALDLADDLRRFLEGRPTHARPVGPMWRIWLWACRNRGLASLAALLVVVTVAALIVISALYFQASADRLLAEQRRMAAESAAQQAVAAQRRMHAIHQFLDQKFIAIARPDRRGPKVTVVEALEAAIDQLDQHLQDDSDLEAGVRYELGESFFELGIYDRAEPLFRRALAILESEHGSGHAETLRAREKLALTLVKLARWDEAEQQLQQLQQQARLQSDAIADLALLDALNTLAMVQRRRGKHAEAVALGRAAVAGYRQRFGEQHPAVIVTMSNLALALSEQGNSEEALALHRSAYATAQAVLGPQHALTLGVHRNLTNELMDHEPAEAEAHLRELIPIFSEKYGPGHDNTLYLVNNLAASIQYQGRYAEAAGLYREAYSGRALLLGADHPETLVSANNYAVLTLLESMRDPTRQWEAEWRIREVFSQRSSKLGPEHLDTLLSQFQLGRCQLLHGDPAAPATLQAVARGQLAQLPAYHATVLTTRLFLVDAWLRQGQLEQATRELQAVESDLARSKFSQSWIMAYHQSCQALLLAARGEQDAARAAVRAAVDRVTGPDKPSPPADVVAHILDHAVRVTTQHGPAEAAAAYRRLRQQFRQQKTAPVAHD